MTSSIVLHFLPHASPLHVNHLHHSQTSQAYHHVTHQKQDHYFSIKCTSPNSPSTPKQPTQPQQDFPYPYPTFESDDNTATFPIEKRRKSDINREKRPSKGLTKPEPPNFEIGWKRTKEIKLDKPKGYVIVDFLRKLEELMDREFGSKELLAKTGEIVAERAREEAEILRDDGEVEERMVTELCRVLRLMEMDMAMVKAAVKEETLNERIQQVKARCRQALLVAMSF